MQQQPDYRDQSEPEVKGQIEETSRSGADKTEKQDDRWLVQGEKETDDTLVSICIMADTFTLEPLTSPGARRQTNKQFGFWLGRV